jgi:hypothetical protein
MMTTVERRTKLPLALPLLMLGAAVQLVLLPRPFRASDDDSRLERARRVNLAYAANMPSFVADETARRYTSKSNSAANSAEWHPLDTIQTEIAFVGTRAVRRQLRRNGKPWDRPFEALPGFKWYGGFGTEIKPLFDSQCPTIIRYQGPAKIREKELLKYGFNSPADGCFASLYANDQQSNPPRSGHIFIDDASGNMIRLEEEAYGFPADFELARRNEEVSWDYVKTGSATHLLPVAANFVILYASGARTRIEVEYKNHRHFEASSEITFHQEEIKR